MEKFSGDMEVMLVKALYKNLDELPLYSEMYDDVYGMRPKDKRDGKQILDDTLKKFRKGGDINGG